MCKIVHISDELLKEQETKRKLEDNIKGLQDELNETKSQVTIAELQKNDVEMERQRYQGDLKTLRRKYDGKWISLHIFFWNLVSCNKSRWWNSYLHKTIYVVCVYEQYMYIM